MVKRAFAKLRRWLLGEPSVPKPPSVTQLDPSPQKPETIEARPPEVIAREASHKPPDARRRPQGHQPVVRPEARPQTPVTPKTTPSVLTGPRRAIVNDAKTFLDRMPVVFDTETTGLDRQAEIVEIAAVSSEGIVLIDTLIRPSRAIPAEATRIHGITNRDVATAPTIAELLTELWQVFGQNPVAAYNLPFDVRLLLQSCNARNLRSPFESRHGDGECIMKMYSQFHGARNLHNNGYRSQKLVNALDQCGLSMEGSPHRALADARGALAVLRHMARESEAQAGP